MTEPYIGQILPFGFSYAPVNWATCQGQILSIRQYTALFSIIGTYYGGDGKTSFALPNLQGNVAVGAGQGVGLTNYDLGETGGDPAVTLIGNQMAAHAHTLVAQTTTGTTAAAAGNQLSAGGGAGKSNVGYHARIYSSNPGKATTGLSPQAVLPNGQGAAHNNMQPYLAVNFCIALNGVFPPRG